MISDYTAWDWLPRAAEEIEDYLSRLLTEASITAHSVTARSKSIASFQDKCRAKGYTDPMRQCTDTVAVRLILFSATDRERATDLVRDRFEVAEDFDAGADKAPSRRGYDSWHLVVTGEKPESARDWMISNGHLVQYFEAFGGLEIQLRTVAGHAWAEFEHERRYKGAGYDALDLADQERIDLLFGQAADAREALDRAFVQIEQVLADPGGSAGPVPMPAAEGARGAGVGPSGDERAGTGPTGAEGAGTERAGAGRSGRLRGGPSDARGHGEGPDSALAGSARRGGGGIADGDVPVVVGTGDPAPGADAPLDEDALAAFLAERFPRDEPGSPRGLGFGLELLAAAGLTTLPELEQALEGIDGVQVRRLMDTTTPVTRVRRLDDELLARSGEEHIAATADVGSVGRRGDQLRWRYDRLRGKVRRAPSYQLLGADCPERVRGTQMPAVRVVREVAGVLADRHGAGTVLVDGLISRADGLDRAVRARPVPLADGSRLWVATALPAHESERLARTLLDRADGLDLVLMRDGERIHPAPRPREAP